MASTSWHGSREDNHVVVAAWRERDEALRLAGVLYNALLVNREAWRTTNASNGATRNVQTATEHAIRVYETGEG